MKKGYSGVLTLTSIPPLDHWTGMDNTTFDGVSFLLRGRLTPELGRKSDYFGIREVLFGERLQAKF